MRSPFISLEVGDTYITPARITYLEAEGSKLKQFDTLS